MKFKRTGRHIAAGRRTTPRVAAFALGLSIMIGCSNPGASDTAPPTEFCGIPSRLFQAVAGKATVTWSVEKGEFPATVSRLVACTINIQADEEVTLEALSSFEPDRILDERRAEIAQPSGSSEILDFKPDAQTLYQEDDKVFSARSVCGQATTSVSGPVLPGTHRKDRVALVKAIVLAAGCPTLMDDPQSQSPSAN